MKIRIYIGAIQFAFGIVTALVGLMDFVSAKSVWVTPSWRMVILDIIIILTGIMLAKVGLDKSRNYRRTYGNN